VELTGNAADATVDPGNAIPEAIRVNGSGQINLTMQAMAAATLSTAWRRRKGRCR
jgi:hypothetical protein